MSTPTLPTPAPTLPAPPFSLPVDSTRHCEVFQYAVKAVCGPLNATTTQSQVLTPGTYYTAVNIHNPSTCKHVTFRWKLAIAKPLPPVSPPSDLAGQEVGGLISYFQRLTLRPDEAVEIDTQNILAFAKSLGMPQAFVKGFVVIETPCELDVVAVYTASVPAGTGGGLSFSTERVPRRRIKSCPETLNLDLSTGVAAWMLMSTTTTELGVSPGPRLANVVEKKDSAGWGFYPGSKWISFRGTDQVGAPLGNSVSVYQTCFTLCSGFEPPNPNTYTLQVMVDGSDATLWVNDVQVLPAAIANSYTTGVAVTFPGTYLKPGKNCISFVVSDGTAAMSGGATGLNVFWQLSIPRGHCPGCGCCADDMA
jgi:hypothetical protein